MGKCAIHGSPLPCSRCAAKRAFRLKQFRKCIKHTNRQTKRGEPSS